MIFQHTYQQVLSGRKTVTRRVVKPGEVELVKPLPTDQVFFLHGITYLCHRADETREITAVEINHRLKWQVGNTYAVQPGRGQKQIGRFRLTAIRQEPLQDISEADAVAEGVPTVDAYKQLWQSINTRKGTRWDENPLVWVLEFKLVREPVTA